MCKLEQTGGWINCAFEGEMARIWGKECKVLFRLGEKKHTRKHIKKTLLKWSFYKKL